MKRVLLIDHKVGMRDDSASGYLASQGHGTVWCSPAKGDTLPSASEFDALILYGGAEMVSSDLDKPDCAYLRREVDFLDRWLAADKPFLGICLGSQLMATALGAKVAPREDLRYELGFVPITPTETGKDFLPETMHMYHWHREGFELPQGAEHLATGEVFPNQAMRHGRKAFGIQFHPEVSMPVFLRWLDEVPDATTRPGADPRDKQCADGQVYVGPMGAWFRDFLDRWLEGRA